MGRTSSTYSTIQFICVYILVKIHDEKCRERPKFRGKEQKRLFVPVHSMKAYGDGGMDPFILITWQKKYVPRMVLKCVLQKQVVWVRAGFGRPSVRLTEAFCEYGHESSGFKNKIVLVFT